jgi:hypothetical protein
MQEGCWSWGEVPQPRLTSLEDLAPHKDTPVPAHRLMCQGWGGKWKVIDLFGS